MNQNFTEKLAKTRDKESLIQLMNELDEEKRRMKTRLSFLIEEQEATRQKPGQLKGDKKALNRSMNRKIEFCHAFLAVAERELPEEKFMDLEVKAMELLII